MVFVGNAYLSGVDATPRKCPLAEMLSGRKQESLEGIIKSSAVLGLTLWAGNVLGDNFFVVGQYNQLRDKS